MFKISNSNPIRGNAEIVRLDKLQNRKSSNFEFRPECSLNFSKIFMLCCLGNGDHKKFTENPRHFSMPNPQANAKKKLTKVFGGQAK